MKSKVKLFTIILAIVIINIIGFILRKFNLDPYIIIAGFRFHISLVLPLFFIFRVEQLSFIKQLFLKPYYNKTFQPINWIIIPLIALLIILFILKKTEIGDPDYFYEFGFSSLVDYPIYLIWNLPQLFLASIFLILIQNSFKNQILFTSIIIVLLFIFEFIPLANQKFNFFNFISLVLSAVIISLLIKYFENIYLLPIITFSIIWSNLLAFGSQSQTLIHLLFAATYNSWDGFFEINKNLAAFLLPIQLVFTLGYILYSIRKKSV